MYILYVLLLTTCNCIARERTTHYDNTRFLGELNCPCDRTALQTMMMNGDMKLSRREIAVLYSEDKLDKGLTYHFNWYWRRCRSAGQCLDNLITWWGNFADIIIKCHTHTHTHVDNIVFRRWNSLARLRLPICCEHRPDLHSDPVKCIIWPAFYVHDSFAPRGFPSTC